MRLKIIIMDYDMSMTCKSAMAEYNSYLGKGFTRIVSMYSDTVLGSRSALMC